jgi:peptide chain release factor 3
MASERTIIEEAYAGDIIGVFDPGIFSIGDTICATDMKITYEGIPTFSPEHFAKVRQVDTMKRKQFLKASPRLPRRVRSRFFRSITPVWRRLS